MSETTGPNSEQEARAKRVEEQLAETKTGRPGATESPADEQPVHPDEVTDEEPGAPTGAGSTTRRGEDIAEDEGKEPGRREAGPHGESERPAGVSDERDTTSVDP